MTDEVSRIYLMTKERTVVELTTERYEEEKDFESLLADHPSLMDGEQIDPENPRRWLLVGRQVGISDGVVDVARWDLDLLFVDQEAIPTLVEVKRKSDTRLRREVFGQILEYAANAPTFWTPGWLKEQFAGQCGTGNDPDLALSGFLRQERPVQTFWEEVHANLEKGNMRLVLVADRIAPEVQRIVEFLNESMTLTEVLALELKYYAGNGYATHVPRVMGRTARMDLQRKQAAGARRAWSRESFLSDVRSRCGETSVTTRAIEDLLDRLDGAGFEARWGTGSARGSYTPIDSRLSRRGPISLYSDGTMNVKTLWLSDSDLAKAWQARIRAAFERTGIPLDVVDTAERRVEPDKWAPMAAAMAESIARSRDESLEDAGV
ncbi:MAG: hypothetical protein JNK40_02770 [Chromatiales bacterium]|nr:hypothetical protein [Chromatiales bacterium]